MYEKAFRHSNPTTASAFSRTRHRLARFVVGAYPAISALALAACSRTVDLVGIQPISPDVTKGLRANPVYGENGSPIDAYRLWSNDVLVLRVAEDCKDLTSKFRAIDNLTLYDLDYGSPALLNNRSREAVRVPFELFFPLGGKVSYLEFSFKAGPPSLQVPLDHIKSLQAWGDVRQAFAQHCIKADLEPVDPTEAAPGETLQVTRRFFITDALATDGGTGIQRRSAETFELLVDHDGRVTMPLLNRIAGFPIEVSADLSSLRSLKSGPYGIAYRLDARLAASNARLHVTGAPLATIAECVSASADLTSAVSEPCKDIDGRFATIIDADGNGQTEITYIMEHGPRSWFLVDETGKRTTIPYSYGQTIDVAVEKKYRELRGRDLIRNSRKRVFVTVVPRSSTNDSLGIPFAGRFIERDGTRSFQRYMLLPGDTVHLTGKPPQFDKRP